MKKLILLCLAAILIISIYGCDKEKIVTTTETVKETEYVEVPGDTVFLIDTIYNSGSGSVDTIYQTNTVYDTVYQNNTIHDTVYQTNTVYVYDTVETQSLTPDDHQAYAALQYNVDPMLMDVIYDAYGYSDGWILYLSTWLNTVDNPSAGVYDFNGVVEYWTLDWSGYEPFEYYFRVTYNGGDPSDVANWTVTDPPATVNGYKPGINKKDKAVITDLKR